MKTPEEVKDAIIDSLAQDTAGGLQLPSATSIIAADRKEAVAEFVREACKAMCGECDNPHVGPPKYDDTTSEWIHDLGRVPPYNEPEESICDAAALRDLAREKGIDL